ncbi:unnamed protein product [Amoebophrya sp. A120]|nr:unnamed protein product [Amoebophrya sp. A120]|eukprot:GSA120T00014996001.1
MANHSGENDQDHQHQVDYTGSASSRPATFPGAGPVQSRAPQHLPSGSCGFGTNFYFVPDPATVPPGRSFPLGGPMPVGGGPTQLFSTETLAHHGRAAAYVPGPPGSTAGASGLFVMSNFLHHSAPVRSGQNLMYDPASAGFSPQLAPGVALHPQFYQHPPPPSSISPHAVHNLDAALGRHSGSTGTDSKNRHGARLPFVQGFGTTAVESFSPTNFGIGDAGSGIVSEGVTQLAHKVRQQLQRNEDCLARARDREPRSSLPHTATQDLQEKMSPRVLEDSGSSSFRTDAWQLQCHSSANLSPEIRRRRRRAMSAGEAATITNLGEGASRTLDGKGIVGANGGAFDDSISRRTDGRGQNPFGRASYEESGRLPMTFAAPPAASGGDAWSVPVREAMHVPLLGIAASKPDPWAPGMRDPWRENLQESKA